MLGWGWGDTRLGRGPKLPLALDHLFLGDLTGSPERGVVLHLGTMTLQMSTAAADLPSSGLEGPSDPLLCGGRKIETLGN